MNLNKTSSKKLMVMNCNDNVAVCLHEFAGGEQVDIYYHNAEIQLKIIDPIPLGHKVALVNIKKDMPIIKYGEIIGKTTTDISNGQHVHVHNVTDYEGDS